MIKCVGSYGARPARVAADAGTPTEAGRMNTHGHRGISKSDPLDACRIAQAVMAVDLVELRCPPSSGWPTW